MDENEGHKDSAQDVSRREALAKLAKLSAYSTPAVVTLLNPQLSHAQASIPPGNNECLGGGFSGSHTNPGADTVNAASDGFFGDFWVDLFFPGVGNDSASDCGQ